MKFGVKVPETAKETLKLDRKNGNTLWTDAIKKEMKNSSVAFNLLGRDERPSVGFEEITCHLVFDVNMVCDRWSLDRSSIINDIFKCCKP